MSGLNRFAIGALGGFVAATSKVLALDAGRLAQLFSEGQADEIAALKATIFITSPLLILLGGIVGWATSERVPMKLLAIGCSAPALVAPWTTGNVNSSPPRQAFFEVPALVSTAFAQDTKQAAPGNAIGTGLKVLFGLESPQTQKYWVVASSHKSEAEAQAYADQINRIEPSLQAFVGKRVPGNDFYPVLVGGPDGYLPLAQANALLEKAKALPIVPGSAYLSAYADRLPASQ